MNAPELDVMNQCPELEDLAAFHDGRLSEAGRTRVLEHLDACGLCLDIAEGLRDAADEKLFGENVVQGRFGGRTWLPAVVAAAVLVIAFGAMFRAGVFAPRDPMREVVIAANQVKERPIAGRLSGNFQYKRHSALRGAEDSPEPVLDNYAVQVAAPEIVERAEKKATPENLRASGVIRLFLGDRQAAVADLRKAAGDDPQNAAVLTDLSAAYYADGKYPEALKAAEDALKIEKTPAALWNRALALTVLEKRETDAIAAWREYLAADPNSEWSEEAQKNLNDLLGLS